MCLPTRCSRRAYGARLTGMASSRLGCEGTTDAGHAVIRDPVGVYIALQATETASCVGSGT